MTPTAWEECLEHHTSLTVVTRARLASKLLRPQMLRYLSNQNVPEALRSLAEAQESCLPLHSAVTSAPIESFLCSCLIVVDEEQT